MKIPKVTHLDVSRFRLREATERLNHREYDLVRELPAASEPAFHGFAGPISIQSATKATGLKQSALKARLFRIRRHLLAATTQI
jgi:hypothetical protein